jgi:O-antigen/teichoic acid export membrane protein
MSKGRQTASGVIWNWIALASSFAVSFFLSPFIVHRLGTVLYGVWALVAGLTSYMSLMDLGLRGAIVRFVSRSHAQGDHENSSLTVSGALWLRQWISLGVILLSVLFSFLLTRFFQIPVEAQSAARWAVILSGTGIAISLYLGVFGGVLTALHRFDLSSAVTLTQTALRAGGAIFVLWRGYGFLGLAVSDLCVLVLAYLAQTYFCFRIYPQLRIRLQYPGLEILRQFAGYSFWVFLLHIFAQVIYYTDNLVVGAVVSVAAVTFYSIGSSLIEYLRTIVASLTTTFLPLASRYQASGEFAELRKLLQLGTRVAIAVALPVQVALFFRGQTFINLWMGPQYGLTSGRVLQILLIAQLFTVANSTSMNVILGMAEHRRIAIWAGGEAVVNLILSILLARRIGIYGVAVGTVIPSLIAQVFLWPRYVCHLVGAPLRGYLWRAWIQPFGAAVPFGIACLLTNRYWSAQHLATFFLQIAAILPVYLVAVFFLFRGEILGEIKKRTNWFSSSDPSVRST